MSGELSERTALITGGTQGLGLEIARQFLRAGASGVCICGRGAEALESALQELHTLADDGQVVIGEVADVASAEDVERLLYTTLERFPELTILVNNAGIYGPKGTLAEVDWLEWARAIEINLYGSVLPARGLFAHFADRGYGKIIQLSGGGATNPLPGISAYAASKAAAVRFAETLAEELRAHHVDVNAVAPGALNTRMLDEVLAAGPKGGRGLLWAGDRAAALRWHPARACRRARRLAGIGAERRCHGQAPERRLGPVVATARAPRGSCVRRLHPAPYRPWRPGSRLGRGLMACSPARDGEA